MDSRAWKVLAVACVLALAAAPAAARRQSRSKTFTTGSFVVTCTSTGQVCSPPESLTFNLARRSVLTRVTYTTSPNHCSSVLVRVVYKGHVVAKTGKLDAGERTEDVKTHITLPKGQTTLGFQAQGFSGGCNAGQLGSWGGKVTVAVTRANVRRHH
jgi:hypothetical protein